MPRSCEAAHQDSKVKAQEGGEIHHIATDHGPMVQGDYSRHIREASMAMEGLPEGVSPSGMVPEQLLQAAPILKRRWRRNREGFTKEGYVSKCFRTRGKYSRR